MKTHPWGEPDDSGPGDPFSNTAFGEGALDGGPFSSVEVISPMGHLRETWLLRAAVAVEKPVDQLTEAEKVALCWINGGELNGALARAGLRFTTARPVGFYNGPDGRVVTVFGPRPERK